MKNSLLYLDNNATTQPTPEVVAGVQRMLAEHWHNPSSAHRAGQAARAEVELARRKLASLLGCGPAEIVFTSGATESIDFAIRGTLALYGDGDRPILVTTPVEHEAIRMLGAELVRTGSAEMRLLPVAGDGRIDVQALAALLESGERSRIALVSVQWANNETGVVQPIESIAAICAKHGVALHTDATQWVGKHPLRLSEASITLLSCTAHKMHGPKGVGALVIRGGAAVNPTIRGVQERERRGGTENAPAIVGFGIAAEQVEHWLADGKGPAQLAALRDRLEQRLLQAFPEAVVHGGGDETGGLAGSPGRLCNTLSIALPGSAAEALVLALSERGVASSAGAACASGSMEPSPVLAAMGISEEQAETTIRLSLSRFTTGDEIEQAAAVVIEAVRKLQGAPPQV